MSRPPLDIKGQRFGQLVAIRPTRIGRAKYYGWKCRCDCGKMCIRRTGHLRMSGDMSSCGHLTDFTGRRYGELTAIKAVPHLDFINPTGTKRRMWLFKCDCGNEHVMPVTQLDTKSCGCLRERQRPHKDTTYLKGQRFGRLTVIDVRRELNCLNRKYLVCDCRCDCGKMTSVALSGLTSNQTTSCGCSLSIRVEGQRYGRLIIIKRLPNNNQKVLCRCDCGNTTITDLGSVRGNKTTSCGCYHTAVVMTNYSVLSPEDIPMELALARRQVGSIDKYIEENY